LRNTILVVAGPTAVGKTDIAIQLALRFNGQIVSCDSMQLYKHMDIGSAKPTATQLAMVPHHLIGVVDPKEAFSVVQYQQMAKAAIKEIFNQDQLPVIAGGTGLYLNALLFDMDFGADPGTAEGRAYLFDIAESQGNEALHEMLQRLDPVGAERIHPNNVKRVVRAIEAVQHSGVGLSDFSSVQKRTTDYDAVLIGLTRDRNELYHRIEARVDQLMAQGLLEEVKSLQNMGFTSKDIAMKGIGYKELLDHLDGAYDLPTAIDLIKRNTRHYAKRQLTWFKRYSDMEWFNLSEDNNESESLEKIIAWLNKRKL
jgi:tRNA dimethylallyltransferase